MSVAIDALYKNAKAVLWVEDPDTRAWLEASWMGMAPTILVAVAGGHANVSAVCRHALDEGHVHVLGMVDQDWGSTNFARWATLNADERVYRLDVPEFENLIIGSDVIAGCALNTMRRTEQQVEARLIAEARDRAWSVAASKVLAEISVKSKDGFPENPGPGVKSLAAALNHVMQSTWFAVTAGNCPELAKVADVQNSLQAAYSEVQNWLTDGSWRQRFPGKELFRAAAAYVHPGKGAAPRIDLVKAIGDWQRTNRPTPQLQLLRSSVLARV